MDLCWAVAAGLGAVDLIRGADFHSRHLLLALRAGEPFRISLSMSFEAAQTASRGGRSRKRTLEIVHRAEELAQKANHPHAIGLATWASGVAAYLIGHWKRAADLCEEAAEILRDRCTGVTWELAIANRFMLSALLYQGELSEVARRVPNLLSSALEQGNLLAATDLRTRMNLIWLAADNPDRARAEVIEALKAWPHKGFHLQHYTSLLALAQNELYTGDGEVAWKHLEGQWKALRNSMLLRIQVLRIEAMHLKARAALAPATSDKRVLGQRIQVAETMARRIYQEEMRWADPLVSLIKAGVANLRNEQGAARSYLSDAVDGFDLANMHLYAAAARRRLGQLIEGKKGEDLKVEAESWMQKQGVHDPERMTRMLAPGLDQ
jgi:hypothetical protein